MKNKKSIAFICVHNSCRSQISEALAKQILPEYDIYSAGTKLKPTINADAVRLLKQHYQIDMEASQYPKLIQELPTPIDYLITMGCGVTCPNIACQEMIDWGLEDPTGKSDEQFMKIIHQIEQYLNDFKVSKE